MTVYASVNIGESSKMSTSLSQAASLDDEPLPMDLASSFDKNSIPDARIRYVANHSEEIEIVILTLILRNTEVPTSPAAFLTGRSQHPVLLSHHPGVR